MTENKPEENCQNEYIEDWIRKNFSPANKINDPGFEEEIENAGKEIESFQNELVKKHANMFLSRMLSDMQFVAVPVEILMVPYLDALQYYVMRSNSPAEVLADAVAQIFPGWFGSKSEPGKKSHLTNHPKHEQARALYESIKGKDPEKIKAAAKEILLDMLMANPKLIDWYEKLFETTLCACWTSYEVFCGDLWEDLVNSSLSASKNVCNAYGKQESESKKLNLSELFKYDLNLSNKMGTLMKYKFDFTSTKKINATFDACFGVKGSNDAVAQSALFHVEQTRHLILHRAGIVDEVYLQKTNANYAIGERIKLTTYELERAMQEVFHNGWELIRRVEYFMNEDIAKEQRKKGVD